MSYIWGSSSHESSGVDFECRVGVNQTSLSHSRNEPVNLCTLHFFLCRVEYFRTLLSAAEVQGLLLPVCFFFSCKSSPPQHCPCSGLTFILLQSDTNSRGTVVGLLMELVRLGIGERDSLQARC